MASFFSLFLAIFVPLVIHFNHEVAEKRKNGTVNEHDLKGVFETDIRKGFLKGLTYVLGGGGGGGGPPLTVEIHPTSDRVDGICFLLWTLMPYSGMIYNEMDQKKLISSLSSGMKMKNWPSHGPRLWQKKEPENSKWRLVFCFYLSKQLL